jgi:hypothetical protein
VRKAAPEIAVSVGRSSGGGRPYRLASSGNATGGNRIRTQRVRGLGLNCVALDPRIGARMMHSVSVPHLRFDHHANISVFFDPSMSDDERRERLYQGDVFVFFRTASSAGDPQILDA